MNSIFTLLTVLFVALKLTHVITWSWWLVLSPAIVGAAIGFFLLALLVLIKALE